MYKMSSARFFCYPRSIWTTWVTRQSREKFMSKFLLWFKPLLNPLRNPPQCQTLFPISPQDLWNNAKKPNNAHGSSKKDGKKIRRQKCGKIFRRQETTKAQSSKKQCGQHIKRRLQRHVLTIRLYRSFPSGRITMLASNKQQCLE